MLRELLDYFRYDLAIDLGTANTRIAAVGEGLLLEEPSVVAVAQGTGGSSPTAVPWGISPAKWKAAPPRASPWCVPWPTA